MKYKVHLEYELEANSDGHALMVIESFLKSKGVLSESEATEDYPHPVYKHIIL